MKKPYTLLAPHIDGTRELRVGDTVYLDDANARWLWEQGGIALDGAVRPRPQVAALLAPKPKQMRCRPCGY